MVKIKYIWCFSLFFLSYSAFASIPQTFGWLKNIEIAGALGANWTHANNTKLVISPYEKDSVRVKHTPTSLFGRIGIGYYVFYDLLLELNYYQSSQTEKGHVWQYGFSQFDNYSFHAPIKSQRLMFDVKPRLFNYRLLSPYVIFGVGVAWNAVSYHESITGVGVDPTSSISLGKKTNTNTAYDLGVGVQANITECLGASAEYLYTFLYTDSGISPSRLPKNGVPLIKPLKITISSQAVLLGFNFKI